MAYPGHALLWMAYMNTQYRCDARKRFTPGLPVPFQMILLLVSCFVIFLLAGFLDAAVVARPCLRG